ncbi:putative tubulin--tyrosine ligase PBY1 [Psilocybe cubensis]|uniref:Survival protein SurE-like phosphatase/nucleotidase domain-containing protein n=2 Tax=Psilocybe cubensis TaxID=181762 RepID=A0A8H8CRN8_PSICU|nr:putative tubulin--tyrosine ligase PBY1 [Psilocybe cubensis]KAH9486911.1 putative tubulin--tyrosine ligase PBY1 [Psilocybe cubensis]
MSATIKPRVLLTNDDGPPNTTESPYIMGLYRHLTEHLGWDVKVVLPSSQKSWIGKAYHIKEVTRGNYFYPRKDGSGEITAKSRPLQDSEVAEWVLLDGTPATCANVALHNLFKDQIDLVISGPNLGRNTSSAFALSSGTIGAAMSSSLSKKRAIALSYGTVVHPTPTTYFEPAHDLGCRIIKYLWHNWGADDCGLRQGEVDLYSVNIPLVEEILSSDGLKICWTRMWRNSYGRLFKNVSPTGVETVDRLVQTPGPDTNTNTETQASLPNTKNEIGDLLFKWAPEMRGLITPSLDTLPVGSDGWALHQGWVSVTPLRASFGEPQYHESDPENLVWKMKL